MHLHTFHRCLLLAQTVMQKYIMAETAQRGMLPGQSKILDYLAEHDGCEQKTLGTVFHLEAATVTGILRRMEEAGLTERRIQEGNRKSQYVFLTEHGKKVVQEIVQPILYGAETKALEGFTEEETERLIEYLRRIYCNMTKG